MALRHSPRGPDTGTDCLRSRGPVPAGVDPPSRAADPAENVDQPRHVAIENRGNETNEDTVDLVDHEESACWDATAPCDVPARRIAVLHETGMIPAIATELFGDVAARTERYTITLSEEGPGADGSRETVRASVDWHLEADTADVHVRITDEDVRFVAPAPENGGEGASNATEDDTTRTAEPRTTTPS